MCETFAAEYGWDLFHVLWTYTLPQMMGYLDARKRRVERENAPTGSDPASEAEQMFREAERSQPPTLAELKSMFGA